jgi:response regulator RpfG family c-di-GMP phosphodiesterase
MQGNKQPIRKRANIRLIYQTSPLHDIGKVGIPDAVLQKPGKLTTEEFDVMKRHTEIGANAIRATLEHAPSAKFLQMAMEIALSHHEKFDGTGYPQGLVGEAIPLPGRVIASVDVYDALATKRFYKPAFSHLKAREIIIKGRGKHFDPVIVDAFLRVEVEFDTIRLTMAEDVTEAFIKPIAY